MNIEARKHLELGLVYYRAADYQEAIREFSVGYELDPRPEFLFAMAQAQRLGGDCQAAVALYRRFLAHDPPAAAARAASDNLERCDAALREHVTPPPEPETAPASLEAAPPQPATVGAPRLRADAAWYRDPIGASLVAGAAASAAMGIGFWIASRDDETAARRATTYGAYDELLASARSKRALALVGFGAAAALGTGAALRYVLGEHRDEAPRVGVALGETGAALWVTSEF